MILQQLRAIGASADWTRTAYTFSPELSRAVREAFVQLYERGLIYRGHRVIHWCPRCLTSLSDEEAEGQETTGALYHVRYPLADDPSRSIDVATTRPETMLGDVAVAVHPDDERYKALIGKNVILPILDLPIPVIADEYVDPAFGTGVVKITPAHDPNDFEVGMRHKLPMPVVIDEHGCMNEVPTTRGPRAAGAPRPRPLRRARAHRGDARAPAGRLVKKEPHQHTVRHCYRCDTVVEPRLSDQWFVNMAPLAEPALEAVRDGPRAPPAREMGRVYEHWMTNIRDWNISRQIWWGHRIPVWYCKACGSARRRHREVRADCHGVPALRLRRRTRTCSTPGSRRGSGPSPRSAGRTRSRRTCRVLSDRRARHRAGDPVLLGRAHDHGGLRLHGRRAVPHACTCTARCATRRAARCPSRSATASTRWTSSQLYGADALRYTLIAGMGLGADVFLDPNDLDKSFAPGRNFATKLWNIGRFLLMNVGDGTGRAVRRARPGRVPQRRPLDHRPARRRGGELRRGARTSASGRRCLAASRTTGRTATQRVRRDGAPLRVERARRLVRRGDQDALLTPGDDQQVARAVLVHVFDQALRLLHPIVPFVTEALWQRLPGHVEGSFLATSAWPSGPPGRRDATPADAGKPAVEGSAAIPAFAVLQQAIQAIRQLRSDYAIPPAQIVTAHLVGPDALAAFVREERALFSRMARCEIADGVAPAGAAAHAVLQKGLELVLPLAGVVDLEKETREDQERARRPGEAARLAARKAREREVHEQGAAGSGRGGTRERGRVERTRGTAAREIQGARRG